MPLSGRQGARSGARLTLRPPYPLLVPARLRLADPAELADALDRLRAGGVGRQVCISEAVLEQRAPGHSVEVRVPPYAAVQCIPGVRHTRGTPPAVVETDARTMIALAAGELAWADAVAEGRVSASGERTELTPHLPLL